jgi:hypothetical protein
MLPIEYHKRAAPVSPSDFYSYVYLFTAGWKLSLAADDVFASFALRFTATM